MRPLLFCGLKRRNNATLLQEWRHIHEHLCHPVHAQPMSHGCVHTLDAANSLHEGVFIAAKNQVSSKQWHHTSQPQGTPEQFQRAEQGCEISRVKYMAKRKARRKKNTIQFFVILRKQTSRFTLSISCNNFPIAAELLRHNFSVLVRATCRDTLNIRSDLAYVKSRSEWS